MAAKMAYKMAAKILNCHVFAPKWQRFILNALMKIVSM